VQISEQQQQQQQQDMACSSNAQHFALALDSSQAKAYDPAR